MFITAIPKSKHKSPLNLMNQRGIFLVPKLRTIFSKLIYNSTIETIEENLSVSNIGARRKKAPRDHLFVLNSVIHDIVEGMDGRELDLVYYDLTQAYDSLWVTHTLTDLYENNINSNLLNLIFELSKEARISIKTPVGVSETKKIEENIMQGENLSSILCTTTVDKVSKDCPIEYFKYKVCVERKQKK